MSVACLAGATLSPTIKQSLSALHAARPALSAIARAIVDTLERVGRRSGYARDRRMHHYRWVAGAWRDADPPYRERDRAAAAFVNR